jgi:hypothetical protein
LACALAAATMTWIGTAAFAQDDEDDVPWDTKIMRRFLKDLGLQRDGEAGIEYRERAPLVVPPSRDLPAPRREGSLANNPAWPKDHDVERRRQDAAATAANRAKLKGTAADMMMEEGRALRPSEMARGGAPGSQTAGPVQSPDESARPLKPSELGSKKGLWDLLAVGPEKTETATFGGEPPRSSLTEPPSGYQTPSPSQPYGLSPTKQQPKAANQADRMIGTAR